MPELVEQMYCSQQIVIPPKFPYLLKRYCKAAIKTQPYDLLRWSFEYFKALSEQRPPPVKYRLEYPVYSTEGGLTRGCLKVLANQLAGQSVLPLSVVREAWQGFCLDPEELRRIFCLAEVHLQSENIGVLNFIALAAGMLTKSLTHTMILLCETLTKEPDGGSAAICVQDFLTMYRFLATVDASSDVKYINGYREGFEPPVEEESLQEEEAKEVIPETDSEDDFWEGEPDLRRLSLINDRVAMNSNLSQKAKEPIIGTIERSPSAMRAIEIEREKFLREWSEKPRQDDEINKQLRQLSGSDQLKEETIKEEAVEEDKDKILIKIFDEDNNPLPLELYGEPEVKEEEDEYVSDVKSTVKSAKSMMKSKMEGMDEDAGEEDVPLTEKQKLQLYVDECYDTRDERRENFAITLEELAAYVDRFGTAKYDLDMVAGRQMSITSGEFIVHHIEKEIMDYIDEQIAILPDPDLKKKKAKPEEVDMIRELLFEWLKDNMSIIVPEIEEVEEEEEPIPDIVMVYAVPGIGPPVDDDTLQVFTDYAQETSKVQGYVFMPRNIRHFMCPPLEKYLDTIYDEDKSKKEELPTGGRFTD